jgi:hypothetical protein
VPIPTQVPSYLKFLLLLVLFIHLSLLTTGALQIRKKIGPSAQSFANVYRSLTSMGNGIAYFAQTNAIQYELLIQAFPFQGQAETSAIRLHQMLPDILATRLYLALGIHPNGYYPKEGSRDVIQAIALIVFSQYPSIRQTRISIQKIDQSQNPPTRDVVFSNEYLRDSK